MIFNLGRGRQTAAALGSKLNPYKIATAAELDSLLRAHTDAYIQLICDIEWPEGTNWVPVGTSSEPFTGNFDGNGFTIQGLHSSREVDNAQYTAFIGVNSGTIKNVRFTDAVMEGDRAAVVVGYNLAGGTVSKVAVASGTVNGTQYGAGIAAYNYGTITNSYNKATITSKIAAGIVYNNYGTIQNVYNTGKIVAIPSTASNGYQAGIAVINSTGCVISGVFTLLPVSVVNMGSGTVTDSATVSSAKMKSVPDLTAAGWDFATVWSVVAPDMYPTLSVMRTLDAPDNSPVYGTPENPWVIMDAWDLINVRNDLSGCWVLGQDITLAEKFTPIPKFSGHLDGAGYQIRGLKLSAGIQNPDGDDGKLYSAIFAVNEGEIKNIFLASTNVAVAGARTYVSTLAGINRGTIERCATYSGSLDTGYAAGGIAAINEGSIKNVYNRMTVKHGSMVGGIVAENKASGSIEDAYVSATLTSGVAGSIAYSNAGSIYGAFAQRTYPLVKDTTGAGYVEPVDSALKLERDLKKQATYTAIAKPWDFTNVWTTNGDTTLPTFIPMEH